MWRQRGAIVLFESDPNLHERQAVDAQLGKGNICLVEQEQFPLRVTCDSPYADPVEKF